MVRNNVKGNEFSGPQKNLRISRYRGRAVLLAPRKPSETDRGFSPWVKTEENFPQPLGSAHPNMKKV
jgi:hypothetical protein